MLNKIDSVINRLPGACLHNLKAGDTVSSSARPEVENRLITDIELLAQEDISSEGEC